MLGPIRREILPRWPTILKINRTYFGKVILFDGWTCDWTAGDELFPAYKAPSTWIGAIFILIEQCSIFRTDQSDKRIAYWSTNWPGAQSYIRLNRFELVQTRFKDEKREMECSNQHPDQMFFAKWGFCWVHLFQNKYNI